MGTQKMIRDQLLLGIIFLFQIFQSQKCNKNPNDNIRVKQYAKIKRNP